MAAGQHNPSRRALLGAAVGLPLLPCHPGLDPGSNWTGNRGAGRWIPDQVRDDDSWQEALAAFEAARAAVREIEAATAGYGFEDEEALLPAHEAACQAMEIALQRMLFVPAPHLLALGIKFEAAFAHELESSVLHGELRFPAILQDIIGLWSAERRVGPSGSKVGVPSMRPGQPSRN